MAYSQLLGIDVSHWNNVSVAQAAILNRDFVIAKASEGSTHTDTAFHNYIAWALNQGKLIGAYHYVRPENHNTPQQEATNFVAKVEPYLGNILLAVDVEGAALAYPEWVEQMMCIVEDMTNVKPLIYIQESAVSKFKCVQKHNFGLWIAKWSAERPNPYPWDFYAIHQYGNSPYDLNRFNGTKAQWLKYCERQYIVEPPKNEGHCTCGCCYDKNEGHPTMTEV